jgi:hypothetical protein
MIISDALPTSVAAGDQHEAAAVREGLREFLVMNQARTLDENVSVRQRIRFT